MPAQYLHDPSHPSPLPAAQPDVRRATAVYLGFQGSWALLNAVAKIDFGADGTKRLLLRFSPVTKL
jgi:hypothetical protein